MQGLRAAAFPWLSAGYGTEVRRAELPRLSVSTGRSLALRPMLVPVLYAFAGVVTGAAMLALDAWVRDDQLPSWVRLNAQSANAVVSGFGATLLFVVSVVYLVRISAVQLNAEPFSARVVREFLTDRVQRHAMGFFVGALAYNLTIVRRLPATGGNDPVPHLAVSLGGMLPVAACIIIFALNNASSWAQIGRLIRRLTDSCVEMIAKEFPARGDPGERLAPADVPPVAGWAAVPAPDSGWVQSIDDDAVLRRLPPGAQVEILVRPGDFVTAHRPLARISGGTPADVAAAVRIGVDPTLEQDLTYGINQLVDIGERAMAQGNSDATTAREVVLHLGVVLRELLSRDLPPIERTDGSGRWLVRRNEQSFDGYVAAAFDRLRVLGAGSPELAVCVLTTIGMLLEDLAERGMEERTPPLRRQAELLLEAASEEVRLRADVERVEDAATKIGVGVRK